MSTITGVAGLVSVVEFCLTVFDRLSAIVDSCSTNAPQRFSLVSDLEELQRAIEFEHSCLDDCLQQLSQSDQNLNSRLFAAIDEVSRQTNTMIYYLQDLNQIRQRPKWYRPTSQRDRTMVVKLLEDLKADVKRRRILVEDGLRALESSSQRDVEPDLDRDPTYTSYDRFNEKTSRWKPHYNGVRSDSLFHELDSSRYASSRSNPWQFLRLFSLEDNTLEQGMASLYALETFMEYVADAEQNSKPAAYSSSSSPLYWSQPSGRNIKKSHRFRPCHYFDYICGTGTGGMSAVLLGVMRFSVPEAIDRVKGVLHAVSTYWALRVIRPRSKVGQLTDALRVQLLNSTETQTAASDNEPNSGEPNVPQQALLQADDDMCQTMCITAMKVHKGAAVVHILKSFGDDERYISDSPSPGLGTSDSRNMPIVDACLASVAPRLILAGVKIKGITYKDATTLDVNSTWRTYKEAQCHRDVRGIDYSLAILCRGRTYTTGGSTSCKRSDTSQSKSSHSSTDSASFFTTNPFTSTVKPAPNPPPENPRQGRYNRLLEHQHPSASFHTLEIPGQIDKKVGGIGGARAHAQKFCTENETELRAWAADLVSARRARAQTKEWSRFAGLRVPEFSGSSPPPPKPKSPPQPPSPSLSRAIEKKLPLPAEMAASGEGITTDTAATDTTATTKETAPESEFSSSSFPRTTVVDFAREG